MKNDASKNVYLVKDIIYNTGQKFEIIMLFEIFLKKGSNNALRLHLFD